MGERIDAVHVVIMGCGRVGSTLAYSLEARGHSVAVIDADADAFRRLGTDFTGLTVTGMGFDREVLISAGIERADAFAAVSSGDNSNIISARLARENVRRQPRGGPDLRRRSGPRSTNGSASRPWPPYGGPPTGCCATSCRRRNTELWRDPTEHDLDHRGAGASGLGRQAAARAGGGDRARVAYLMRFGIGTLPTASTVIQDGDQVFMLVTDDMIETVTQDHRHAPEGRALIMRVAIAGAGNVGRSIAAELIDNGHQVMLIERQPTMLRPERVPAGGVGAGRRVRGGQPAGGRLETCDVVVAATGDDKVNLVVSLLAKTEFAVNRVVARVNRAENEWLFTDQWGVDVSVSKPRLMAALVEEAVTVGDLVR